MPSLKDLRNRISSVKSTQKITSAMKMVAAAKLRRAQETAEAARPYADRMGRMLGSLAVSMKDHPGAPAMLVGTGKSDVHLVIVATADRGLCGSFNSSIVRDARRMMDEIERDGGTVKLVTIGRKANDQLRRQYADRVVEHYTDLDKPGLDFEKADAIARRVTEMFEAGEFDTCTIIFNQFKSIISQIVTRHQLIPFEATEADGDGESGNDEADAMGGAVYEAEPSSEEVLTELLPRNLAVQVFSALLENYASEQGARMSAMDNATRNAGEMIDRLTLNYNRARQAAITTELIEIISGAEAL
ncbi:MAG: F0F1 ATP synthase subunit gamma [Rhodospirillaceae bacterium]|jgi:F-type H+-transporting ATPase subunit gamma|nr:F0F1 ATP synthase subunit gamma [Rhodospirillaceae bacterium]MBT6118886.1 F0F1 ATP synthase subunit gamma [Rhodospirillaceae bacterium]